MSNHLAELKKLFSLEEKLNYVGDQVGIEFPDIDQILAAYLRVREQNKEFQRLENEHWNEAVKRAREYFTATQGDYFVSYEELSKMTLQEICEKLN